MLAVSGIYNNGVLKLEHPVVTTKPLKVIVTFLEENKPTKSPTKKKKYKDDTAYLLSTKANKKTLIESIAQLDKGERKAIKIKDLWK